MDRNNVDEAGQRMNNTLRCQSLEVANLKNDTGLEVRVLPLATNLINLNDKAINMQI